MGIAYKLSIRSGWLTKTQSVDIYNVMYGGYIIRIGYFGFLYSFSDIGRKRVVFKGDGNISFWFKI